MPGMSHGSEAKHMHGCQECLQLYTQLLLFFVVMMEVVQKNARIARNNNDFITVHEYLCFVFL